MNNILQQNGKHTEQLWDDAEPLINIIESLLCSPSRLNNLESPSLWTDPNEISFSSKGPPVYSVILHGLLIRLYC